MKRHKLQGITLIEVLVGITIVAILTSVATPSFTALLSVNRLATQANEILGALTISRSEAIRLNKRVVFCRSDDGTSCAAGGGNWQGWLVFADNNGNDMPAAGEIRARGRPPRARWSSRAAPRSPSRTIASRPAPTVSPDPHPVHRMRCSRPACRSASPPLRQNRTPVKSESPRAGMPSSCR